MVIGAGKTGIDSCLHLLDIGVTPARIRWVMPRDAWFIDRANMQPGRAHLSASLPGLAAHCRALGTFDTPDTLFADLETSRVLHRLDPSIQPTKCRGANVSRGKMARLRTVEGIVRLGRVVAIESSRVVLQHGAFDVPAGTGFVNCSASAVRKPGTFPTPAVTPTWIPFDDPAIGSYKERGDHGIVRVPRRQRGCPHPVQHRALRLVTSLTPELIMPAARAVSQQTRHDRSTPLMIRLARHADGASTQPVAQHNGDGPHPRRTSRPRSTTTGRGPFVEPSVAPVQPAFRSAC